MMAMSATAKLAPAAKKTRSKPPGPALADHQAAVPDVRGERPLDVVEAAMHVDELDARRDAGDRPILADFDRQLDLRPRGGGPAQRT